MRGVRSKDNCYLWEPENTNYSTVCSIAKEEKKVKLWHQKLGHLHLRGMKGIISMEAVRGIPRLQIDKGRVCGEYQVERLGEKRYAYVVVNNFEVFKELCKRIQREKEGCIVRIRSDHGNEFENSKFDELCSS